MRVNIALGEQDPNRSPMVAAVASAAAALLLIAGLGRFAFGWGFGLFSDADDVQVLLEDRGYEVHSIERGHFKGIGFRRCSDEAEQWYADVVDPTGTRKFVELCVEDVVIGKFVEPRIWIWNAD